MLDLQSWPKFFGTRRALLSNYSNFNWKQQNMTAHPPPPPLVNVDQPEQEKSSSFLVNIQNLTTLNLTEGEGGVLYS